MKPRIRKHKRTLAKLSAGLELHGSITTDHVWRQLQQLPYVQGLAAIDSPAGHNFDRIVLAAIKAVGDLIEIVDVGDHDAVLSLGDRSTSACCCFCVSPI